VTSGRTACCPVIRSTSRQAESERAGRGASGCSRPESRLGVHTRIQEALANLDHDVGRGTIATILRQHGIEPAPERQKRTTWCEFLKAPWDVLAAADFFSLEVWTATGLTRNVVLFVI
jgi:hypothetical protein